MKKTIPSIQKYMTTSPHSIGSDQSLEKAEKLMKEFGIRHLPVLADGKLCGVISDRDVKFLKGFKDVDPRTALVSNLSSEAVYTVSPSALLDEVCETMAEHKYGSAVVVDNDKLVGIFTWVDGMRAMSELLHTRLAG